MARKIVNIAIAFIMLIIIMIPVTIMLKTDVNAVSTSDEISSYDDGDYVFFIVDKGETPLAMIPANQSSHYVFGIVIFTLCVFAFFIYSSWYLTVRMSLWELSGKLPSAKRKSFKVPNGFFHPVRSYRLCKEAEHDVVSVYSDLFN